MRRVLALLAILSMAAEARPQAELPFRVVVHGSNPVLSLSRGELSAIFMRRARNWSPVDQTSTSRIRRSFSTAIHGKSVGYVVRYWQRLIFAGRAIPPPEARSDAAVLEYVRRQPDAIGYVDLATPLPEGVRAVVVTR